MIEIIYDHRMPLRDSSIRHFIIHKGTIILLSHFRSFYFKCFKVAAVFVTPGSRVIAYKPSTEGRTPVLVVETPEKKKVVIAGNFNDEAKKVTVKLRDRYLNIELQPHSFNTFEEK